MTVDITQWTGASSNAWDTGGNWTNGVPASTDTVVIAGAENITGGAVTANNITKMYVSPAYTGAIGTAGTPLQIETDELYYDSSTASATSYIHLIGSGNPDCYIDGAKTGTALVLSGDIYKMVVGATFVGTLTLGNGSGLEADPQFVYFLSSNGTLDAVSSGGVDWVTSGALHQLGGTVSIGDNCGTNGVITISAGTMNVTDWDVTTGDTLNVYGGTVNWTAGLNMKDDTGTAVPNTVHTINLYGGTFSTAGNSSSYLCFDAITQYAGTLNLESDIPNTAIDGTLTRYAGDFTPQKQSTLTVTAK
jgi:hypothetical protein